MSAEGLWRPRLRLPHPQPLEDCELNGAWHCEVLPLCSELCLCLAPRQQSLSAVADAWQLQRTLAIRHLWLPYHRQNPRSEEL